MITAGTVPSASTTTPITVTYRSTLTSTQTLDIYVPGAGDAAITGAVVFLFHGGGFTSSGASSLDSQCVNAARALARIGIIAISVNYRYAQAGVASSCFPGATLDALCAFRWGWLNVARYGGDPERIGAVGFSAGGTLVAHAVLCMQSGITTLPNGTSLVEPSAPYQPGPLDAGIVKRWGSCYGAFDLTVPSAVTASPFLNLYVYLNVANQADPNFLPRAQDASPSLLPHTNPALPHWHGHGDADPVVFYTQSTTFAPTTTVVIAGETHNYDPTNAVLDKTANLTLFWGGPGSLIGGL